MDSVQGALGQNSLEYHLLMKEATVWERINRIRDSTKERRELLYNVKSSGVTVILKYIQRILFK